MGRAAAKNPLNDGARAAAEQPPNSGARCPVTERLQNQAPDLIRWHPCQRESAPTLETPERHCCTMILVTPESTEGSPTEHLSRAISRRPVHEETDRPTPPGKTKASLDEGRGDSQHRTRGIGTDAVGPPVRSITRGRAARPRATEGRPTCRMHRGSTTATVRRAIRSAFDPRVVRKFPRASRDSTERSTGRHIRSIPYPRLRPLSSGTEPSRPLAFDRGSSALASSVDGPRNGRRGDSLYAISVRPTDIGSTDREENRPSRDDSRTSGRRQRGVRNRQLCCSPNAFGSPRFF